MKCSTLFPFFSNYPTFYKDKIKNIIEKLNIFSKIDIKNELYFKKIKKYYPEVNLIKIFHRKFLNFNKIINMASILVFFIILTDNFKKIGLIRVLKEALK